ncbi:putative sh3 domain-containing protein [Golovinomyces cichoracearum]|uniref:Putative sh3 domain-containing protein n=1 Tax=Golovinomyces cichoracearum TaxID=62708 RepID=A0A420HF89_9PEZI|nr:putative sh3 domain-containing protein [Golovinomyces cichoracearum]
MASMGSELFEKSISNWENKLNRRNSKISISSTTRIVLVLLWILSLLGNTSGQRCISLRASLMCPAFSEASISATDNTVVNLFPFLRSVTDTSSFDEQLKIHISTGLVQQKYLISPQIFTQCLTMNRYQQIFGCHGFDLGNTTDLYARFTTSVMCNAIIQNSRDACALSNLAAQPVCAETCAQQAESESLIIANRDLCPDPNHNVEDQIRADFTNCALPANSLSSSCINGALNEPENCGFRDNTVGLCQYCASGGINSTDTCCYNTDAQNICTNVTLPIITGFITFTTSLPSPTSSPKNAPDTRSQANKDKVSLSPKVIAGISIGSIFAFAILGGLIYLFILCVQRRHNSRKTSKFDQSSSSRFKYISHSPRKNQSAMAITPALTTEGYESLPGGRIARMSALEDHSNLAPKEVSNSSSGIERRNIGNFSSSESNLSFSNGKILRPPPTGCRTGSLSSNSVLGFEDPNSPHTDSMGGNSSPLGPASHQSEQLLSFKDYYSVDEIHPGDKVATLWAYQPRAGDEFALERGDMLKVAGIWDDGWATGVMIDERADEWDSKRNAQRDSGVSNTATSRQESTNVSSEIKAFPLVCVCLPEHWKRTIEVDLSIKAGSSLPGNESDS